MPRSLAGHGQWPGQRIRETSFTQFPQFSFGQLPLFPEASPQPPQYPRIERSQRRGGLADGEVSPYPDYFGVANRLNRDFATPILAKADRENGQLVVDHGISPFEVFLNDQGSAVPAHP